MISTRRALRPSNERRPSFARSWHGDGDLVYTFELAERLGMTVRELRREMPVSEFRQWQARDSYASKDDACRKRVAAARGEMKAKARSRRRMGG